MERKSPFIRGRDSHIVNQKSAYKSRVQKGDNRWKYRLAAGASFIALVWFFAPATEFLQTQIFNLPGNVEEITLTEAEALEVIGGDLEAAKNELLLFLDEIKDQCSDLECQENAGNLVNQITSAGSALELIDAANTLSKFSVSIFERSAS